jgi:hypothetical protein
MLYAPFSIPCMLHSHLVIIFCKKYKFLDSSFSFPQPPIVSSLLGLDSLLSLLFKNTSSLFCSLNIRDRVLYPHKTTCRIMVLYILTFAFLDIKWKVRMLWTGSKLLSKWYLTISLAIKFWFFYCHCHIFKESVSYLYVVFLPPTFWWWDIKFWFFTVIVTFSKDLLDVFMCFCPQNFGDETSTYT